jgi:hypothetical protein
VLKLWGQLPIADGFHGGLGRGCGVSVEVFENQKVTRLLYFQAILCRCNLHLIMRILKQFNGLSKGADGESEQGKERGDHFGR